MTTPISYFSTRPPARTDVHQHEAPETVGDRIAYGMAHAVDRLADLLFRERYAHRALVLETIAAVPGMLAALLVHLRSVRRLTTEEEFVRELFEEAENERNHMRVFTRIAAPLWWELALIKVAQFVFVLGYFPLYIVSSSMAHRFVAYLEENAIASYTRYLALLQAEPERNVPAPAVAFSYWPLPPDAMLADVVSAIRDDELGHRDANHRWAWRSRHVPASRPFAGRK